MDIRKVKKLIQLLEESGLSEIEITEGEDTVRITRRTPKDNKPKRKIYSKEQCGLCKRWLCASTTAARKGHQKTKDRT